MAKNNKTNIMDKVVFRKEEKATGLKGFFGGKEVYETTVGDAVQALTVCAIIGAGIRLGWSVIELPFIIIKGFFRGIIGAKDAVDRQLLVNWLRNNGASGDFDQMTISELKEAKNKLLDAQQQSQQQQNQQQSQQQQGQQK